MAHDVQAGVTSVLTTYPVIYYWTDAWDNYFIYIIMKQKVFNGDFVYAFVLQSIVSKNHLNLYKISKAIFYRTNVCFLLVYQCNRR